MGEIYKTNTNVVPIIHVGMYGSALSDFSYLFDNDEGKEFDYDHFDYAKYKVEIGKLAAKIVESQSKCFFDEKEDGIVRVFSDGHITSPMFYNFETDELNIDVEVTPDFKKKMVKRMNEWIDDGENGRVQEYATKHFKSYDGFDSFVPYKLEEIRDKILMDYDIDRLVGVYAALVLVSRGYFQRGKFDDSPAEVAYQELIEDANNLYYDDFIIPHCKVRVYDIEWDTSDFSEEEELASGVCVSDLPSEVDELELDIAPDENDATFTEAIAEKLSEVYEYLVRIFTYEKIMEKDGK